MQRYNKKFNVLLKCNKWQSQPWALAEEEREWQVHLLHLAMVTCRNVEVSQHPVMLLLA